MKEVMQQILLLSAVGSVLALVLLCSKPLTKRLFSPRWQYYIWLTVLLVMVLPVKVSLPVEPIPLAQVELPSVQTQPMTSTEAQQEPIPSTVLTETVQRPTLRIPQLSTDMVQMIGFIWLSVAALLWGYRMTKYRIFLGIIKTYSVTERGLKGIPKRLSVRKTELLDSPLLVGLINPCFYLPQRELTEKELEYILLHELTHYRRHDVWYKWFAMVVTTIHWFNPLVYLVSKQIDEECEVSCDYEVCRMLSEPQKKDYMGVILSLVQASIWQKRPLATQMASSKQTLERRFLMIQSKKATGKLISLLSAALAIAMLTTTAFASGVLAGRIDKHYTVEITNHGEVLELVNKPFVENGEVYVPLRETLKTVGVLEHEGSSLTWTEDEITVILTPDAEHEQMVPYGFQFSIDERTFTYGIYTGNALGIRETACCPPILKDSVTYLPYEMVDRMLNHRYQNTWSIAYTVFDAAHSDKTVAFIQNLPRKLSLFESQLLAPNFETEQTLCYDVICVFFDSLQAGDLESMKSYCTTAFAESELADGTLLGYRSGKMQSVYAVDLYADGNYRVTVSFYPGNDSTDEADRVILAAAMAIQSDGRVLIDDIEAQM